MAVTPFPVIGKVPDEVKVIYTADPVPLDADCGLCGVEGCVPVALVVAALAPRISVGRGCVSGCVDQVLANDLGPVTVVCPAWTTHAAAAAAATSYITYHRWITRGLLRCEGDPRPGPGNARVLLVDEVRIGVVMGELVTAGLRPEHAARAARNGGQLTASVRVDVDLSTLSVPGARFPDNAETA